MIRFLNGGAQPMKSMLVAAVFIVLGLTTATEAKTVKYVFGDACEPFCENGPQGAVLTLRDYVPGTPVTVDKFIDFIYVDQSRPNPIPGDKPTVLNVRVKDPSKVSLISAAFPTPSPTRPEVIFTTSLDFLIVFDGIGLLSTSATGGWVSFFGEADIRKSGASYRWSAQLLPVPVPSALPLMVAGALILGLSSSGRRRQKMLAFEGDANKLEVATRARF
jgi:hypothetical protein